MVRTPVMNGAATLVLVADSSAQRRVKGSQVDAVVRWTGREVRVLREVLRMSVRAFAAYTQLSVSRIAEMETQGADARLRPSTQRILDAVLAGASERARRRFCTALAEAPSGSGPRAAHVVAEVIHGGVTRPAAVAAAPASLATIGAGTTGHGVWETDRRAALAAALGLTSTAMASMPVVRTAIAADLWDPAGEVAAVGPPGSAYGDIAERLWRLYWTAPAGELFGTAYAHMRLGGELVHTASGSGERDRLWGGLALSALLAARLAFFDLDRRGAAARCHGIALAAAAESRDDLAAAIVLGHMAFAPAFAGDVAAATELVRAALPRAEQAGSVAYSWLHCVASEAHARAGDGAAALRRVEAADAAFMAGEPVPGWFDFYDEGRLHCFAGYAAMAAGDPAMAVERLSRAVDALGDDGAKQRSVVYADLAAASGGDGDRAAAYLHQAVDALEASWYGTGWQRIRQTRDLLGDSGLARDLDQRLALLAAGT
jgi:DNA-binding transcriptional regulator YiaG